MQPLIAANPGHQVYAYCFDVTDGDVIRVFQQYTDEDAARAFLERPAYREYLQAVEPLLTGDPEVVYGAGKSPHLSAARRKLGSAVPTSSPDRARPRRYGQRGSRGSKRSACAKQKSASGRIS